MEIIEMNIKVHLYFIVCILLNFYFWRLIMFVDKDEQGIAGVGRGYAANMLQTGELENNSIVVTNKRIYFNGEMLCIDGIKSRKVHESKVVDLKDVTGTSVSVRSDVKFILGWILAVLGVGIIGFIVLLDMDPSIALFNTKVNGVEGNIIIACLYLASIIGVILLLKAGKSSLTVEYAGGNIRFSLNGIGGLDIEEFAKAVRWAKSNLKDEPKVTEVHNKDIAGELERYGSLLEKGLITKEEFEDLKRKLLTKSQE